MGVNRRDVLKLAGVAAASAAVSGCTTGSSSPKPGSSSETAKMVNTVLGSAAPLPKNGKGARVVVVGGGWSGLTVAKYVKKYAPDADVVLIEKRAHFVSCPLSNLWLVDMVNLEFLSHSFTDAAKNNGYTFFNATVHNVDRTSKTVHTNEGTVNYDYLVLAPGIGYDYSAWTNGDMELEYALRTQYPAGFMTNSEHGTIKNKLMNFEEGNFILTTPGGNYRCLPAPYERACLMAGYMKANDIKGKIILMDENADFTIKKEGFGSAFKELYGDYIEHMTSTKIVKFDLANKKVETEFGEEVEFADAAFYPHVRGNKLLETAGVAKDSVFNKKEADINPFTYQVNGDPNVFCSGDVRPMGFSKSGNTSNSEGQYVAKVIANRIKGKETEWTSPLTICYSAVADDPLRAISVNAGYSWNPNAKTFGFANASTMEDWHGKSGTNAGRGLKEWASGMYRDMFM